MWCWIIIFLNFTTKWIYQECQCGQMHHNLSVEKFDWLKFTSSSLWLVQKVTWLVDLINALNRSSLWMITQPFCFLPYYSMTQVNSKFLLMKSSEKYLIMWLMISPMNFEKIAIFKIRQLVFFWGGKIHFGMK